MSGRDLLRIVLSNLNRMRMRVALTAIGVIIGTMAVILLISLGVGLQRSASASFDGQFSDLTTIQVFPGGQNPFGGGQPGGDAPERPLDRAAIRDFAELPGVVVATPRVDGGGRLVLGREETWGSLQGIDPDAAERLDWKLAAGRPRLGHGQIVLGQRVFGGGGELVAVGPGGAVASSAGRPSRDGPPTAEALLGRTLTLELSKLDDEGNEITRSERLRVAGVFEIADGELDYSVYAALEDVEEFNRWAQGTRRERDPRYGTAIVKVADRERVTEVQDAIEAAGFGVFSFLSILEGINRLFVVVQLVLGAVGAVALAVAAIGIANTMTMAIYERTREIGIMKAVGATNRDVLRIFLSEAGAIGCLGGAIGVGLGGVIGWAIDFFVRNRLQASGTVDPPHIVVTPLWLMAFALGFSAVVGLVSGVYPALRAASMKPLRALRGE